LGRRRWLHEALDGLGLKALHLVGYSEGGWLALVHAAKTSTPQRLKGLVLLEPGGALVAIRRWTLAKLIGWGASIVSLPFGRERRLRAFSEWLSPGVELTDAEVEWVLTVFRTFRQHLPMPRALSNEQLGQVLTPRLLLLGEDSAIYDPEAVAERATRVLPEVEVEIVPGAGHGLPFQFPEVTSERILTFVRGARLTEARPRRGPPSGR
jgi:pimeloyl-ACP methyl ester carboxylesterase